jgi:hypothetical protein
MIRASGSRPNFNGAPSFWSPRIANFLGSNTNENPLLAACPGRVVLADEAGLRVGVACCRADLVAALERIRNSFSSGPLDRLSASGAILAFEDEALFARARATPSSIPVRR